MQDRNWYMNIFRSFFGMIDHGIYSLIKWAITGIFDIVNLQTNVSIVNDFRDRIYIILGIFMLFKLSFSLISYIVNPDQMMDKEKGANKLVGNTMVMLVILMLLPTFFNFLGRAEEIFLPVLPKLILGDTSEQDPDVGKTAGENAEDMAVLILRCFYSPPLDPDNDYIPYGGTKEIETLQEFRDTLTDKGSGINIGIINNDTYKYNYTILISTVVGIITLVIIVMMTIDIASRVFKMIILEMIAPIPVMSYIDPKSKKDGAFAAWTKQLFSTFFDVFVKIGILYLVLFFIKELGNDDLFIDYGMAEGQNMHPARLTYLTLFLILGLLKFAQDGPKFIKSTLGIKDNGGGNGIAAAIGAVTGGIAGVAGGLVGGHGIRGAISGGLSAANNSYNAAKSGKAVPALSGYSAGRDAALQTRLGDPKAKGGIINNLSQRATKSQGRNAAKRHNLTQGTLDRAKQNMLDKKNEASYSEQNYKSLLEQSGNNFQDQAVQDAYQIWQKDAAAAAVAESNYSDAKEAWAAYGQKESFAQKTKKYQPGKVYHAKKAAKDAATNVVDRGLGAVGLDSVDQMRKTKEARRTRRETARAGQDGVFDPNKS